MPFTKKSQGQLTVLSIVLVLTIILYSVRIYSLQVVNASDYIVGADVRTAVLKAPRGEILDCYGRRIAINRDGYNVVFNKAYVGENLNDVILTLIRLFEQSGVEWIDTLPMTRTSPYDFNGEDTEKLIKTLGLAHYATAQNCFARMSESYKLDGYTDDDKRRIMGVRYSMSVADFSISYPYTFAEDIPTAVMLKISESGFMLNGVSVDVVPFREYNDTTLAVNLIGEVGPIYETDWDEYKKKGYSFNDKVGKSGIEAYAEEYLRGTDGEITYNIDPDGNIISSVVSVEPVAGKTVMLTLDKTIQRTAQDSLAEMVRKLKSEGSQVKGGAAVAVDIKTGGVICAANYPTYDSATYHEMFNTLASDPSKPLNDRAFQGVYPIGSTIKPIVAMAALEHGLYHIGETITCVHTYRRFEDYTPSCMGRHGAIVLKRALAVSCNYFFFELGFRVGATTLTDYYKQFGLGVKTQVEVDDSAGILIEPSNGSGDTLQISIGQMNAFTPLQVANYTATLANGGTHRKATLISKIVSYDLSDVYDDRKPVELNTVSISPATLQAVKEGMLSVTEDGTGRAALGDYPIKVGGKTGTSQVDGKEDNSVFIAFAPYDNPQIAISVVLENGNSGFSAGTVVKNILNAYFYAKDNASPDTTPFTVLG